MPPFPSLTKIWHTDSYPAISPTRPELSAANKTVVVTGGGTGIGASIARSFAVAGSKKIAIIGRRPKPLEDTARQLQAGFPELKVVVQSADITNQEQVNQAFDAIVKEFGTIDVLASNAGVVSGAGTINELDVEEAWKTFEGIVKGNLLVARAFSRVASKQGAVVVHTSSVCAALRAFPGSVAYTASKIAATKIWDYFGVENPGIRVVSIQPGQIQTTMADELGIKMPDSVDLPGHFVVWLASPEAQFLNGKFVYSNWDVEELLGRKTEFETTELGTIKYDGLPSA
ncbi:unnamed protein product [Clonostachys rhizophaga]|uniref:Ketoreductase domain-containing protein n=1 Tax=Clonostachys rhizophaga TaxID=160324 RepID=A0A9N9VVC3_9HYPO|nr:unnamed protein product [Clonostachys rhizophaga]